MDAYFYDEFKRCIFFDVFEKALKDLNVISKNKKLSNVKSANNKNDERSKIFFNLNSIIQDDKNVKELTKEKEYVKVILMQTKSFILDLQSNIKKLPIQISYMFTKLRKRLKRYFTDKKNEIEKNEIKEKINKSLLKFFLKNIIGEKLKTFCNERKDYFSWTFGIPLGNTSDNYFETFK
jgi:hypothetical protein